ncbi:DNA glycosylase [Radiomyces spectabilis]|uniref:DNA glycosylase n=1 Tax=Radiomyces spectabilis TaxID=64574 RepID=UPI002221268B|nr:DNA glycosylase [Radiomyces spectabilis]KAI8388243.1 DNA glycosylase [Radiomyces spectabilis]
MSRLMQATQLVWHDLKVSPKELRLDTLRCGQSFRWRRIEDQWACVLKGRLYVLKETPSTILYGTADAVNNAEIKVMKDTLTDYFQLNTVSLQSCYERWAKVDPHFKDKAHRVEGIRILRQCPWECLVAFICSSNNNIARISQMVHKLCVHYGPKVVTFEGIDFHDFPTPGALATEDVERRLRELGFGYRAKYIAQTAQKLRNEHPGEEEAWLASLRTVPYDTAKQSLIAMPGVGPKVADCVCLMSMDHAEAIPVDTHVWQIASKHYGFNRKGKTLTTKLYDEVGDHFRLLFGTYSGWAHSVLFTADLKSFEDRFIQSKVEMSTKKITTISTNNGKRTSHEEVVTIKKEEQVVSGTTLRRTKRTRLSARSNA